LAIASSVFVQVALLIQRASNRARLDSMSEARIAGSRARMRIESSAATSAR